MTHESLQAMSDGQASVRLPASSRCLGREAELVPGVHGQKHEGSPGEGHAGTVASDAVNHPQHYGGGDNRYEAIKVIEAWGLGFCLGNAVKYIARAGRKTVDPLEDLRKARWYIDHEIANLEQSPPKQDQQSAVADAVDRALRDAGHPAAAPPPPAAAPAPDVIERVRVALDNARAQIEYLHEKFQSTGSGNASIARITEALRLLGDAP